MPSEYDPRKIEAKWPASRRRVYASRGGQKEYNPSKIEKRWQNQWEKSGIYKAEDSSKKPKYYSLIEFPYPSGDGLHVGHPRPYIGLDVISRKRRMEGFNVLYPIGWDAFGLPTENFALKTGKDPRVVTKENTETFRRQIKSLGISFDWSREINTTDPEYYKWTQWLFLRFLEHDLAYKAKAAINWCPTDRIGLANEEVIDDKCERCGTLVEKREKEQWMLAITKYADRLDKDLDTVDYPERVKVQQRNWIGKSEGALIKFGEYEIFTTRPDTIFGATYLAISGKADKFTGKYVTNPATKEKIPVWEAEYVMSDYGTGAIMGVPAHDERDFEFAKKHNLPIREVIAPWFELKGKDAMRPGLEMLERDCVTAVMESVDGKHFLLIEEPDGHGLFPGGGIDKGESPEVALKREVREETGYTDLEIKGIIFRNLYCRGYRNTKGKNQISRDIAVYHVKLLSDLKASSEADSGHHSVRWLSKEEVGKHLTKAHHQFIWQSFMDSKPYIGSGVLVNSGDFSGMSSGEARKKITEKFGKKVTRYKLRDWVFSRQRYWGEPIPVIHCERCGMVPVPEKDLPVELPKVKKYEPGPDGESPLANIEKWASVRCPKCKGNARRETDVMPNWAGSSWYFYRYADPDNKKEFASPNKLRYWMPVDWYNGGMEHTVLHLLYSRFWNKFFFDIGLVPTPEPYKKRTSHGLILAEGGEKMSKSRGNTINPDSIVERFGADTLRLYEMFMGPFDQAIVWSEEALVGPRRFLEKVWRLREKVASSENSSGSIALNQTIKKVSLDIEAMRFNTAISSLMVYVNTLEKSEEISRQEFETLLQLLAPFAPHITEELWLALGYKDSIHTATWPVFDQSRLKGEKVTIAVQVNGKVRGTLTVSETDGEEEVKTRALALPEVNKWLGEKPPKKVIFVAGRVVNVVT